MGVNIIIDSKFDDKGIKDALKDFAGQAAKRVAQVGAAVAAAGAVAAGKLAVDAVRAASDFEESVNAVNVAFGEAAQGVLEIGENAAQSLGVSRNEFNQAAVRFSAFAERVVGEGGDVAEFIGDVSQRAADFASVFNIEVSEALQVFQSGLAGEAEPLKRFGINLLQTEVAAFAVANGISASASSMTEAEKVQARYGLLMEQTNKTAGDFANTSGSLANTQRRLTSSISDLQVEIGSALLPVAQELVETFAANLLPRLEDFGNWLQSDEGIAAVNRFGDSLVGLFDNLLDFGGWIAENLNLVKNLGIAIAGVVASVYAYRAATILATAATAGFTATLAANPLGAIAVALTLATTAATIFFGEMKRGSTADINTYKANMESATDSTANFTDALATNAVIAQNPGVAYRMIAEEGRLTEEQFDALSASLARQDQALADNVSKQIAYRNAQQLVEDQGYRTGDAVEDFTIEVYENSDAVRINNDLLIASATLQEAQQRHVQAVRMGKQFYTGTLMDMVEQVMAENRNLALGLDIYADHTEAVRTSSGAMGVNIAMTDASAQANSGLGGSYQTLTTEIDKATEAQRRFAEATPGAPGPGGLFEVTMPDGSTALANLDGIQEGLRVAGTSGGGYTAPERTRQVGLGFQGVSTVEEALERGWEQLSNGLFDTLVPLANGGIVSRPTAALIGEAGKEAVIPLSEYNMMRGGGKGNGGVTNIYVNVQANSPLDAQEAGKNVVNSLGQFQSNNGNFNVTLSGVGS